MSRPYVNDLVVVSDQEIVEAMGLILERCKVVAEPAAAFTLAALLSGQSKPATNVHSGLRAERWEHRPRTPEGPPVTRSKRKF